MKSFELDPAKKIRIGRSSDNEIVINNKVVSARHASITFEHSGFFITDTGSRNGIHLNGKQVKKHHLTHGDVVSIGRHELVFSDKEYPEQKGKKPGPVTLVLNELDQLAQESKAERDENLASSKIACDDQKPLLIVKFKDKILYKYPLQEKNKIAIGRGTDNQIVLDNPAVSTNHAVVVREGDDFEIVDINSKNGTFVNDKKISRHTLKYNDIIAIGRHFLVFSIESEADCTSPQALPPTAAPPLPPEPTKMLDTRAYKDMLHRSKGDMAPGKAELAFLKGGSGSVPIKKNIMSIGSAEECDIVVKGLLVGESAAFIIIKSDGYYLTYNRGLTKPTVNGEKIDGSRKLYDGDVIKIGSVTMQFGL
ncbi:MAG: FHA domain-containing protein [Desulfobulbaceae bacterium]|nr:FHA domain-containing protein [Desulfobulbaceae bacterium]